MENNFDNIARSALKDMEVPYRPQDWQEMSKRLDQEQKKGPLFLYKGIELSVIALAIWTLLQFAYKGGGDNESTLLPASPEPRTIPAQENLGTPAGTKELNQPNKADFQKNMGTAPASPEKEEDKNKQTANTEPVANTKGNSKGNIAAPITSKQKAAQQSTTSNNNFLNNNSSKANLLIGKNSPKGTNYSEEQAKPFFNQPIIDPLNKQAAATTIIKDAQAADKVNAPKLIKPTFFINALPSKSILLDRDKDLNFELHPVTFNSGDPLPKLKPNRYWHVRVFGSPDMNMMNNSYSLGASMGGLLGKDITKQFLIESGLVYNHKRFTFLPGEIEPVAADPVQLTDILISQIEIPVNMQFTIKKSTNWRPYAVAGLSANFILYSDYDYSLVLNESNKDVEWQHQYPENGKGLVHGGSLKANNYYTANLGIGLERQLDNNLHLFVQPTYKYALNGMGIDDEKLNTFSLVMGVRARLK